MWSHGLKLCSMLSWEVPQEPALTALGGIPQDGKIWAEGGRKSQHVSTNAHISFTSALHPGLLLTHCIFSPEQFPGMPSHILQPLEILLHPWLLAQPSPSILGVLEQEAAPVLLQREDLGYGAGGGSAFPVQHPGPYRAEGCNARGGRR